MFDLIEGLIRRKYTDAQIASILGDNFKRVLREICTNFVAARRADPRGDVFRAGEP